jgi:hypothetical protein
MPASFMNILDELGKLVQEYLRMSQLTQRKIGRGDNNEAGETPYFET